jgi:hypothetical protein
MASGAWPEVECLRDRRLVSQYCEEIEMSARDNGILPAEASSPNSR